MHRFNALLWFLGASALMACAENKPGPAGGSHSAVAEGERPEASSLKLVSYYIDLGGTSADAQAPRLSLVQKTFVGEPIIWSQNNPAEANYEVESKTVYRFEGEHAALRDRLEVSVNRNGDLVYKSDGAPLHTPSKHDPVKYVITEDGRMFAANDDIVKSRLADQPDFFRSFENPVLKHSSFAPNERVVSAGQSLLTNGRPLQLNNHSGHYRFGSESNVNAIAQLNELNARAPKVLIQDMPSYGTLRPVGEIDFNKLPEMAKTLQASHVDIESRLTLLRERLGNSQLDISLRDSAAAELVKFEKGVVNVMDTTDSYLRKVHELQAKPGYRDLALDDNIKSLYRTQNSLRDLTFEYAAFREDFDRMPVTNQNLSGRDMDEIMGPVRSLNGALDNALVAVRNVPLPAGPRPELGRNIDPSLRNGPEAPSVRGGAGPEVRVTPELRPNTPELRPNTPELRPNTPELRPVAPEVRPNVEIKPVAPEIRFK